MVNNVYGALPVSLEGLSENEQLNIPHAILIREEVRMVVTRYEEQSTLWENSRVRKALRIFPVVGFMSSAALTCSYAAAFMAYCYRQDTVCDNALMVAKWSQICLLGNMGAAIGVRLVSKISGRWTSETRRTVFNTMAATFPCFFAWPVCCEVEPGSSTITVLREVQTE